jgi:8-oxo-(d)GTP phosphatase
VSVVLVRHASAGSRKRWAGDDHLRPLDERGRRQAAALVDLLADHPIALILSSPSVRCVQTVGPLARQRGLRVDVRRELGEGSTAADVLSLLDDVGGAEVVLCTHGDVILELLGQELDKGATVIVRRTGNGLEPLGQIPPAE